jgi:hypothetical protein
MSVSLHAVVDRGGDYHHGDAEHRHPDQDGADPANAVVDDGANHLAISAGGLAGVNPRVGLTLPTE